MERFGEKVGFIGGGNMAKAICDGIVKKGLISYSDVHVSGPHLENLQSWKENGANVSISNGDTVKHANIIFLCVKPHLFCKVLDSFHNLRALISSGQIDISKKLFISVMAGIRIEKLQSALQSAINVAFPVRVIRTMPNTPLLVGEGCTVYCLGSNVEPQHESWLQTLMSCSGICESVTESQIDAFCALSGGGPAFTYMFIQSLADGAVKMGIPRAMANQFAAQTVLGAAKMCLETGKHPGLLKDEVCSPSGTTIAGVHALERGGLRATVMDAIEASTKRAQELSNQ